MVLLSAAIKSVPADTVEAARIDGANELQIFWRVHRTADPSHDHHRVHHRAHRGHEDLRPHLRHRRCRQNNTNVIGIQFYIEQNSPTRTPAHAAAIVVMLMIAVVPVMIYQVRHFRAQEANR